MGSTPGCANRFERLGARALRAGLALVFALSPVLGTLHEATARHVACPDDGELIDAPAQAAHAHPQASTTAPVLFPELPLAPGASGSGHDHCVVALQLRAGARVGVAQPTVGPAPRAPEQPAVAPSSVPNGIDELYRIAPKASPPA